MFDIGFSELMLIGLVALIVIGPERLPGVARTVGHLIGRLQRYVADVKADINREVDLDELRKMRTSVEDAADSIETSITSGMSKTEDDLKSSLSLDDPAKEEEEGDRPTDASGDGQSKVTDAAAAEQVGHGPERVAVKAAELKP